MSDADTRFGVAFIRARAEGWANDYDDITVEREAGNMILALLSLLSDTEQRAASEHAMYREQSAQREAAEARVRELEGERDEWKQAAGAEAERADELQARVRELEAERDEYASELQVEVLARSATEARVAQLEAERDEVRYAPLGDNHHNAAACPHCGDLLGKAEALLAVERERTQQLADALKQIATERNPPYARIAREALAAATESARP